jgi:hypothetical protein
MHIRGCEPGYRMLGISYHRGVGWTVVLSFWWWRVSWHGRDKELELLLRQNVSDASE